MTSASILTPLRKVESLDSLLKRSDMSRSLRTGHAIIPSSTSFHPEVDTTSISDNNLCSTRYCCCSDLVGCIALGDGLDLEDVLLYGRINVCNFELKFLNFSSSNIYSAWWISDRSRPPSPESPLFNKIRYDTQAPPPKNFLARINSHPLWVALSADIFTGQIIASLIVLTFVAVFLLREWISQNARPGVFEDEEPLPEEPLPVAPQQPEQIGPVPPLGPPARLVFANPQQRRPLPPDPHGNPPDLRPREVHPRLDALLPSETAELGSRNLIPPVIPDPSRWDLEKLGNEINRRQRKKKNKVKKSDNEDDDGLRVRHKMEKDAEIRRRMFHRRIHMAKTTAIRHRMTTRRAASSSPSASPLREVNESNKVAKQKHKFTFTAPLVDANHIPTISSSELSRESSVDLTSSWQSLPALPSNDYSSSMQGPPSPESPFPPVTLQLPTKSIPFPLQPSQPNEPPSPFLSRPLLPTIPLPRSGSSSPFFYSPGRTGLDSPSHSTYRAPEELAASQESGPSDYFTRDDGSHQRNVRDFSNEATMGPAVSTSQTDGSDTESLSDIEKDDIQAEHDRYFGSASGTRNASAPPVSLELLSDSESDITTEDDGRGIGDLDDDEGQPVVFVAEDAGIAPVRDGDNAIREGNIVRGDGPPLGQAVGANQAGAEVAAANAENEEGDANVEDDMEGAMEGVFFVLLFRR